MADQKLIDLTATTTPASTDLAYIVIDPAGTPLDRKVTLSNLVALATGLQVESGTSSKISALTADTAPTTDDLIVTVNDPSGTPANKKVTLDNLLTSLKISRLLGYTQYNPGTLTNVSTSSTTGADVDATNLSVVFTVPASGNVLVSLSAIAFTSAGDIYWWCVRTTGGTNIAGRGLVSSATVGIHITHKFAVTGLTPGISTTWRWGHGISAGTGNIRYGDDASTSPRGPAIMEVYSIP